MKTRQCIFIGYGHDEYGYRMYDPVEKKLVRSRDVQFMEDQTIKDIVQNGEQHNYDDQLLGDGFDVPLDDDVEEEQEMSQDENLGDAPELPPVQLRRSNRQKQSSTRYTSDEYVILIDGEEPECYQESMESEERQKAWQSKLQKYVALSTTKAESDRRIGDYLYIVVRRRYVGLFLGSQLCGQKPNTLKPARSLFIRGEGVRLSRHR
ncbi:hypothetical protein CR513_57905, partial [Mucuna pruriens]